MRAVVTGAAGFVGSTLVDRLLDARHQVIGIDDFSSGTVANLAGAINHNESHPGRFRLFDIDIQAPELAGIIAGANPDVIFHLAAQADPRAAVRDPHRDARTNVLGTINLSEAGRLAGIRRIVYATCAPAGSCVGRSHAESPHAAAKLAGEMYLRAYAQLYGSAPICLALGNVYGPRQIPGSAGSVITSLAEAMITGQPAGLPRDDTAGRGYIYVDDVVEAFMRAGRASAGTSGTYDISTGRLTTVAELKGLIAAAVSGVPAPHRADLPSASPIRPTEAGARLGWFPAVDIADGIGRVISWLSQQRPLSARDTDNMVRAG